MKRIQANKAAALEYLLAERQRRRTGVERTYWLLRECGLRPQVAPNVLAAILRLLSPPESHEQLVAETRSALRPYMVLLPQGLEFLPGCWLKGLPGIWKALCRSNPRWKGTALDTVSHEQGVLRMTSVQEQNVRLNQITVYDLMRIAINRGLYPSLWRPLKRSHERLIWQCHPELRRDLFQLPDLGVLKNEKAGGTFSPLKS